MNPKILHTQVQDFIRNNAHADLYRLLLQPSPFTGIHARELAEQIESRQKAAHKLPLWHATGGIYYPNKRNLEQSSSERTAAYKAALAPAKKVIDLTGGFGADTFYFSKYAETVQYCEADPELAAIATHNFARLGADNITTYAGDGMEWLFQEARTADLIYIDPSRRSKQKKRVFLLSDCHPDITGLLPGLLAAAATLMVKTSPLLDLTAGLRELDRVKEVHIVAVNNEVKEVLWLLGEGFSGKVEVITVNLTDAGKEVFSFAFDHEKSATSTYSDPLSYLYEPNAAIMKSGGFQSLGAQYQLHKLHEHSHLYTSHALVAFPGRRFHIQRVLPFSRKTMQQLAIEKANVSTRNFPETVAGIRKRFKISDGGPVYLFFTKSIDLGLIVIECKKI